MSILMWSGQKVVIYLCDSTVKLTTAFNYWLGGVKVIIELSGRIRIIPKQKKML